MNILITGGLGFIGSHTAAWLAEQKYENIILFDNLSNVTKSPLKSLQYLFPLTNFIFVEGDIRNVSDLNNLFSSYTIDVVIHMAALKSVKESTINPLTYYDNNIIGTINLLKVMKEYNCNNLIFSSSCTVYGEQSPPISETSSTGIGIASPYGQTKYIVEKILMDYSKTNSDLNFIILRYFNPIGAHQSGLLGEYPSGIANNLFPSLLGSLKGLYKPLTIFGSDYPTKDGTCIRDYIDINDLAIAHVSCVNKLIDKTLSKLNIFNIGTGKGVSVLELVNTFERVNNIKVPYSFGDRRPGDICQVYADVSSETIQKLEWTPFFTLEDSCKNGWLFIENMEQQEACKDDAR